MPCTHRNNWAWGVRLDLNPKSVGYDLLSKLHKTKQTQLFFPEIFEVSLIITISIQDEEHGAERGCADSRVRGARRWRQTDRQGLHADHSGRTNKQSDLSTSFTRNQSGRGGGGDIKGYENAKKLKNK